MIELEHASRWYGQIIGLNDVTCTVPAGVTALLGPNGAGKSTFMKLVSGQLRPTTGRVTVLGERPFANGKVFRRLGYCPEVDRFWEEMTGREFVTTLGSLALLRGETLRKRVEDAICLVGMAANADRKIGGYSKGMRQRIKLAQAMIHDPDVLLLDEPLNGLDPVGRREMSGLMHRWGQERSDARGGKCVVVSSHVLHEVEQMTRNILLIQHGRLLAQGDVYQIRGLIDKHPHRISLTTSSARALARELLAMPGVVSVRFDDRDDHRLEVETRDPDGFYDRLPEIVLAGDFDISGFESPDNNLEAVFRYLTQG